MLLFLLILFSLQHSLVASILSNVIGLDEHVNNSAVIVNFQINEFSNSTSKIANGDGCMRPANLLGFTRDPRAPSKCYVGVFIMYFMINGDYEFEYRRYYLLNGSMELPQQSRDICNGNFTRQLPKSLLLITMIAKDSVCETSEDEYPRLSENNKDHYWFSKQNLTSNSPGWQSEYHNQFKGHNSTTSISTTFSMTCLGQFTGPSCDLKCMTNRENNTLAHCVSIETGKFSVCKKLENGQVTECREIAHGDPQELVVEWEKNTIAVGILLLSVALAFLFGFKFARRTVNNKENKDNIAVSYLTLSNL